MTPFERHGIAHLSPASLNLWISQPGIWALRYLGKTHEAGAPKMWRGNAVEQGLAAYLRGQTWEESLDRAMGVYYDEIKNAGGEQDAAAVKKQGDLIEPMLTTALLWTPPSQIMATQIKVEHRFDDIPVPVQGYIDFGFEGIDVDLKTKEKLIPPSAAEIRQASLYRAARQRAGGLLVVTDKKYAFHEVTDEMRDAALADLRDAALKMAKLLSVFDKPEDVMSALPVDYDHFRAPKKGALPRGRPSATSDFTAVTLET